MLRLIAAVAAFGARSTAFGQPVRRCRRRPGVDPASAREPACATSRWRRRSWRVAKAAIAGVAV